MVDPKLEAEICQQLLAAQREKIAKGADLLGYIHRLSKQCDELQATTTATAQKITIWAGDGSQVTLLPELTVVVAEAAESMCKSELKRKGQELRNLFQ